MTAAYDVVIGLEVHAQLQTQTKLFCACPNRFGDEENLNTCPICTGLPGVLPVLNKHAVELAIRAALALDCTVQERSIWARKNYFYPDLPKGYQVTQFDKPYAQNGHLEFVVEDPDRAEDESAPTRRARILRIHMEEDAGKSVHKGAGSVINFNRACTPLVEIVTEPDLRSAREAAAFVKTLRRILRYVGVCDGNMEEGSLRCDANVSLKPRGQEKLGTRTEIKNINSFRFIKEAVTYEIARQKERLNAGDVIVQETRLWDSQKKCTRSMRSKEEAHDYRYFPDPDLPPVIILSSQLEKIRITLPALPHERIQHYQTEFGLSHYDALVLTENRDVADFFESACAQTTNAKAVANWIINDVLRELKDAPIESLKFSPEAIAELVNRIDENAISGKIAKQVFSVLLKKGGTPNAIIKDLGLEQITDTKDIERMVREVLDSSPQQVAQYRAGKTKIMGYLVGQVMKRSQGKANPGVVNTLLLKILNSD